MWETGRDPEAAQRTLSASGRPNGGSAPTKCKPFSPQGKEREGGVSSPEGTRTASARREKNTDALPPTPSPPPSPTPRDHLSPAPGGRSRSRERQKELGGVREGKPPRFLSPPPPSPLRAGGEERRSVVRAASRTGCDWPGGGAQVKSRPTTHRACLAHLGAQVGRRRWASPAPPSAAPTEGRSPRAQGGGKKSGRHARPLRLPSRGLRRLARRRRPPSCLEDVF